MNPYLSVIVPVYNVESYLAQCLDSILTQTFMDVEIILVNDGSTDSSLIICKEYSKKDSRIKVINQPNAGVSAARNKGIELAIGDYLTFVDSDDWLEPAMYEEMIAITRTDPQPEVVMSDFISIKKHSMEPISANIRKGFYTKAQIIEELYPTLLVTENFGRIPIVSVWNCVFRRSLLEDYRIRFNAELRFSEDYLFMAEVMIKINSFYYAQGQFLYKYRQYEESRSKYFQASWWENLCFINKELKKLLADNTEYNFKRQLKLQLLHSVLLVLSGIAKSRMITSKMKVHEIRKVMKAPDLESIFSDLKFEGHAKSLKLVLYLIKYKLPISYLLYHKMISVLKNA